MAIAGELVEARRAPDVGADAPVRFQQVGRGKHLEQDRAEPSSCTRFFLLRALPVERSGYIPLMMPSSAPSGIAGWR